MASANTSLNGYEFGRTPKTTAPFWAGGGEGAVIDDTGVYSDRTWSSQKINNELSEKADADDVYAKNETYTKAEVDALIEAIEPSVDAYTKAETDTLLDAKADKATTYTKSEVDALISDIPAIDAYTKSQTDALLETKAAVTSVYMKSETYTKGEVDALIEGVTPTPVDAYTKAQTDALLNAKANAADVYTKTQTDNLLNGKADSFNVYDKRQTDRLLADKANAADVYTKTQTDDLVHGKADVTDVYTKSQTDSLLAAKADESELASYAKATSVYTKTQTYTKAEVDALIEGIPSPDLSNYYTKTQTYSKSEVDDLIAQAGGGAEIDDTTSSTTKVWSSDKVRKAILNSAGLQYTTYVSTQMSRIRAKAAGSSSNTRNAMTEQFSEDYQYSLPNGTVSVEIMYENGSAGQTYTINLTDIPWNDLASAEYTTNYPSDNSRWKTIVASEDIFEICIAGNVSGSSGYYYPYIFVRVPKGTYAYSITVTPNLGNNKWTKAGSVAVINGYAEASPLFTKDITSMVSSSMSASAIIDEIFMGTGGVLETFINDQDTFMKFNKMVVECSKTVYGTTTKGKFTWDIKRIKLLKASGQNISIDQLNMEYNPSTTDGVRWICDLGTANVYKITLNIPSSNGNVTGSKVLNNSATLDTILFGYTESYSLWTVKFYE